MYDSRGCPTKSSEGACLLQLAVGWPCSLTAFSYLRPSLYTSSKDPSRHLALFHRSSSASPHKMAPLVSGYGSSDDEDLPGPSSRAAPIVASQPATETVEDEDDEAVEAAARADAFGLSSAASSSAARQAAQERKAEIAAAPDVLKEDPNKMSNAIITRPTDKVMNVNISYADMQRPVQGPEDPFNQKKNKGMNSLAGE